MAASTLYFNIATRAADNTEKWSVNTTRMVILHCDLSHENVASCDQARISACATCFRLALLLRVTRCGRHVPIGGHVCFSVLFVAVFGWLKCLVFWSVCLVCWVVWLVSLMESLVCLSVCLVDMFCLFGG